VNGAFARRFRAVARNLGGDPHGVEVEDGRGFDLGEIRVPGEFRLLAVTQNETSTGVALDPGGIAALARRHPEIPTVVDTVTAAPTLPLELGAVDGAFFSVQKLFGLPAGLGVLVVSPRLVDRVRERQRRGAPVGGYMHIPALADAAARHETGPTPNMLGIRLLKVVARALLDRGMEQVREDAGRNAVRLHHAATRAGWIPVPARVEDRSTTVLVFRVPGEGAAGRVRVRLQAEGFQVSSGYGPLREAVVRLANFPAHPPEAVDALARRIEALDLA
jgi:phosphoserine aminotransferase